MVCFARYMLDHICIVLCLKVECFAIRGTFEAPDEKDMLVVGQVMSMQRHSFGMRGARELDAVDRFCRALQECVWRSSTLLA